MMKEKPKKIYRYTFTSWQRGHDCGFNEACDLWEEYHKADIEKIKKDYNMLICLEQKIKNVIVESMFVSHEQVKPESRLINDFGADSFDVVELIRDLEKEFDIEIQEEDADKLNTVKDVIDYIENRKTKTLGVIPKPPCISTIFTKS